MEEINCLFCFCPLYHKEECCGYYHMIDGVKDCSKCNFPHKKENFDNLLNANVTNALKVSEYYLDQARLKLEYKYLKDFKIYFKKSMEWFLNPKGDFDTVFISYIIERSREPMIFIKYYLSLKKMENR